MTAYRLSICIPTLNRGAYIRETLESICSQIGPETEVVIVDGGSTDGTDSIVSEFASVNSSVRYVRREKASSAPSNEGFDRDCSFAVELAKGDYCWLMTDDDVLLPGAVEQVLERLAECHDLIVPSCEIRDQHLDRVLLAARPSLMNDAIFGPSDWPAFFRLCMFHLTFVGAVVIRKSIWMNRDSGKYFGTGFVHVGVLFSEPLQGTVLVLKAPLVAIRNGNAQWTARGFKIFMFDWPNLVWSFPGVPDEVKQAIVPREPWRLWRVLLLQRAYGRYSKREFDLFLRPRLAPGFAGAISLAIAMVPKLFLFPPAMAYGYLKYRDPRFFMFNLRAGVQ